jgi:hypothetical protein
MVKAYRGSPSADEARQLITVEAKVFPVFALFRPFIDGWSLLIDRRFL